MRTRRRTRERGELESDVWEQLYAVEPEEFVSERKRLERALRDEGRNQEADEIAAKRKPALPVYIANRLAHQRPEKIAELIDIAEELSAAHQAGDASKLRNAQSRLGEVLRELVKDAEKAMGRPISETVEKRLAATLRAAAVDSATASLLRQGVLSAELESVGFDALAGIQLTSSRGRNERKPKRSRADLTAQRSEAAHRARIERIEHDLLDATDELHGSERARETAERDENRARKRVADLENQLARARAAV